MSSKVLATWDISPGEVLDFDIDCVDWLADRTDSISTIATTSTTGLTVQSSTHLNGVIKVWVHQAVLNSKCEVKTVITTVEGRKKNALIVFNVR